MIVLIPDHCLSIYFNTRNKFLIAKLLKQGYKYHKFRKAFSKFYRRHFDLVSKYNVRFKTLLLQVLSEPAFYGDVVYKFRKIIGKNDLPYPFKTYLFVLKRLFITTMFCDRLHAWLLIQSKLIALFTSLIAQG